jgi:hypothetical protein
MVLTFERQMGRGTIGPKKGQEANEVYRLFAVFASSSIGWFK